VRLQRLPFQYELCDSMVHFRQKTAKSLLKHQRKKEHGERMAALREKRLEKLQDETTRGVEKVKAFSKNVPKKSDTEKAKQGLRRQTPSNVLNGNASLQRHTISN